MKIKWLKTLGLTATIGFIGVPILISSISCNSTEPFGGKLPSNVLKADTSNIKTFADAKKFAIDFLNKNYNLAMFKKDFDELHKKIETISRYEITSDNLKINKDKTLNFKLTLENQFVDEEIIKNSKITLNCKNFQITPLLFKIDDTKLKLGFYIPFPSQPENIDNPDLTGDNIDGTKNDMFLSIKKASGDVIHEFNCGWTKTRCPTLNNDKIYDITENSYEIQLGCFLPITFDIVFNNINDIDNNLYKKPNNENKTIKL